MKQNCRPIHNKQIDSLVILPTIADYVSRQKWEEACWNQILKSAELLQLLVAPYERHNLVMRAAVREKFISGKSYAEIGNELWLSPQTISSIKKSMTDKNYRSYRDRGKKERKKRIFNFSSASQPYRSAGTPRRTKYGTIYLPG